MRQGSVKTGRMRVAGRAGRVWRRAEGRRAVGGSGRVGDDGRLLDEVGDEWATSGRRVRAVAVRYPTEWDPGVPLVRLACERRSLGRPIAAYVREVAVAEPGTWVTVLVPETEPERL